MPIGIFLFALKSEFQKSEKNGEKRKKPEKISGFSVGIFFVKTHWRHHPESNRGIKVLQTSALPLGYGAGKYGTKNVKSRMAFGDPTGILTFHVSEQGLLSHFGADYGARTRHLDLGKVALYQMS